MTEPPTPTMSRVEYADLPAGSSAAAAPRDLELLGDVKLEVTVQLGAVQLLLRDLLALQEGSVIELDRAAGAAVDVLVNGRLIARGDVVVIDEELGVRITEIVARP